MEADSVVAEEWRLRIKGELLRIEEGDDNDEDNERQ